MPLKQSGSALLIILLAVLVVGGGAFGVYKSGLVEKFISKPTQTDLPSNQAQNSGPSLSLETDKNTGELKPGDSFVADVLVSTEEPVNVISTKVKYPKEVKVKQIVDLGEGEPISMWVNQKDLPAEGFVQLIGGIPNPGFQTRKDERVVVAKIEFEVVSALGKDFAITPTETELFSNISNKPLEGVDIKGINSVNVLSLETSRTATMSLSPAVINTGAGCSFEVTLDYDATDYPFAGNTYSLGMSAYLLVDESKFSYVSWSKPDDFGGGNVYAGASNTASGPEKNKVVVNFIQSTGTPTGGSTTFLTYKAKASAAKLKFKTSDSISKGQYEIKLDFDPNNPQNSRASSVQYTKVGSGNDPLLNRLSKVSGATINIGDSCSTSSNSSTSASSTATSSASLSTTTMTQISLPKGVVLNVSDSDGDVSGDGKFTLSDLSTLFTRFNKKVSSLIKGDMNKDGIINTLDYSVLKGFMVKKKVISE